MSDRYALLGPVTTFVEKVPDFEGSYRLSRRPYDHLRDQWLVSASVPYTLHVPHWEIAE